MFKFPSLSYIPLLSTLFAICFLASLPFRYFWVVEIYGVQSKQREMIASGVNLVMTVIGFAVSTMFIVFVCTRLICARIQMSASRRAFPAATRSQHLSILERGLHGLEPVVVSNFPTKNFGDKFLPLEEDSQCAICLVEYQEKDVLRILPFCGHSFHVTCIDIWLQQHSTCPVCRVSLRDSPEGKRLLHPLYSQPVRFPQTRNFSSDSYCGGHDHSARVNNHQRTESVEMNQTETSEAGEAIAAPAELRISEKDAYMQELVPKHIQSPQS